MDRALTVTLPVLIGPSPSGSPSCGQRRPSRGHGLVREMGARGGDCEDLEVVDLTGCVSAVLVGALT
ncbi:hypothetical protein J3R82DRAFT_6438 [Butyriboletus roseoflavus]|nr:hypothetical protein J3R82DRAFT_6438 [Butyriboletus roseoflavus]